MGMLINVPSNTLKVLFTDDPIITPIVLFTDDPMITLRVFLLMIC